MEIRSASKSIFKTRSHFYCAAAVLFCNHRSQADRYGHLTQTGSFKVLEKEINHHSSIYGKIVDANGRTIVSDADVDMKVPQGGKFVPAPMRSSSLP